MIGLQLAQRYWRKDEENAAATYKPRVGQVALAAWTLYVGERPTCVNE